MNNSFKHLAEKAGFGTIENGTISFDKRLTLFAKLIYELAESNKGVVTDINKSFDEQDIVEKLINRANIRRLIGRSVDGKPDRIAITCVLAAEEIIRLRQEIDSLQLIGHARDTDIDKVLVCCDNIFDLSIETKSCWPEGTPPYPHLVPIYTKDYPSKGIIPKKVYSKKSLFHNE